ncbi:MAG: hypothetical protein KDC24_15395 [Saprospiraceae bacterium]|nr:hypothetical protein [Saprospiraceae bacterium]
MQTVKYKFTRELPLDCPGYGDKLERGMVGSGGFLGENLLGEKEPFVQFPNGWQIEESWVKSRSDMFVEM